MYTSFILLDAKMQDPQNQVEGINNPNKSTRVKTPQSPMLSKYDEH